MNSFKCKMCGGTIEYEPGATVGACDSCGTKQTLPRLDDERRANLYDRANHFRRNNEFDKAAGIYEQILTEDTTDAEAYWSLVLCQYGIEYVEDPSSHKRVPTVNRAQFTSIFDDDNYKSALQYSDAYQRVLYEQEANEINEIQKGILAISQREDPFDVFICYKETDQNGRRTPDSVLANDLYHQLIQEGFKVFFSRITLEDKLGTAYEPYIFAALNSAKVMVVLGTKPEYFNAVWVKNEWSRFLALVKKSGGKKILIPAYKDMDPYDLPEEFSHLQAQDMSKLGFMQDLLRGIKKIVQKDEPKSTVKETVVVGAGTNISPLLKRVFIFLEDGEWQKADDFCEQVLNQDPENAQAYLGKLMAELKVFRQNELANCDQPFDTNSNYQKAIRYGDEKIKGTLDGYLSQIHERNEKKRLDDLYVSTLEAMKKASSEEEYKKVAADFRGISGYSDADTLADQCLEKAETCRKNEIYNTARGQKNKATVESLETAIQIFGKISGWKDADEQISACQREIETIKARQEADRIEQERITKQRRIAALKAKRKRKIIFAIIAALALACAVFAVILIKVIIPNNKYNRAVKLYNEENYSEAIAAFEALNGYRDSAQMINDCESGIKYKIALDYYNKRAYDDAKGTFEELNGFRDSVEYISKCEQGKYEAAIDLYDAGKYEEAIEAFTAMNGYKDSTDQIARCEEAIWEEKYKDAVGLYNAGKYEEAIEALKAMNGYKNSAEQISKCEEAIWEEKYKDAVGLYSAGKFEEAITAFMAMDGYKDSAEQITKCEEALYEEDYKTAINLANSGKYYEAYWAFSKLKDYKDSLEQKNNMKLPMLKSANKGDTVVFGQFSNAKIYNEWIVIDKQGEKLFLISRVGIGASKKYHNVYEAVTWEKCSLRVWLNGEYITKAFSSEEQALIISTKNKNPNNPTYGTTGGKDTVDKVFLISIDEVQKYFPTEKSRQLKSSTGQNLSAWWWLRSPGGDSLRAAVVYGGGSVDHFGMYGSIGEYVVRPALWINLGS